MRKNKATGFTLIELMGVLALVGIITFFTVQQTNNINQMTFATRLATETLGYSKMANRFINNRYQDIYEMTKTTPIVVSWDQITTEIKAPMMPKHNLQGLSPCVWITQSGNQIQPYLFFVNPSTGKFTKPTPDLALDVMQRIGPQSGYS